MKTLTVTFSSTPNVPVPPETGAGPGVGVRITVTRPDTTTAQQTADKLVWTFGNMLEGQRYTLLAEVVDAAGKTIQALPLIVLDVPEAATYTRLDGYTLAWS